MKKLAYRKRLDGLLVSRDMAIRFLARKVSGGGLKVDL
jgi:hypothetical protein